MEEEHKPKTNSMAAFSPKRDELYEALSILYIRNNASGRNRFKDNWPDVAPYIFGAQLIKYDHDGWDDVDHCRQLEDEADQRRVLLKDIIEEMVDKSVDSGALQFEYVGKVIDNFGPLLSTFLYAEDVIERVRPGILASAKSESELSREASESGSAPSAPATAQEPSSDPVKAEAPLSEKEAEILSNKPKDDLDDVKPIDTSAPNTTPEQEAVPAQEEPLDPVIEEAMKIREGAIGSATFESDADVTTPQPEENKAQDVAEAPSPASSQESASPQDSPSVPSGVQLPEEKVADLDDVRPIEMPKVPDQPSTQSPSVPPAEAPPKADSPATESKPKPSVFGAAPKPKIDAEPEKAAGFKKGLVLSLFNTAAKAA